MSGSTLVELFESVLGCDTGVTFIASDAKEERLTYSDLHREALSLLGGLRAAGVEKGDFCLLQLEENREFLVVFWACVFGGVIPVPLTVGYNDEHKRKVINVWRTLGRSRLIADAKSLASLQEYIAANGLSDEAAPLLAACLTPSLLAGAAPAPAARPDPSDLAFIQFSSGSTSEPKGVMLTHGNLAANVSAIISGTEPTPADSTLSWMPLTHDMGLIGFHIAPLAAGVEQCLMPTSVFIRRPMLWLKKAHEHQATILSSPNFGYRYFLDAFQPKQAEGWDLSGIRIIFNGAEPISAELCREFLARLRPYGLKDSVVFNVYGLAEACLAVTFPPLGEGVREIRLRRGYLGLGERVREAGPDEDAASFVDLGYPVEGCEVAIRDLEGRDLPEETVGLIHIRGANVTGGYYGNPGATAAAIGPGGWLNTGDLGILRRGRLVFTGRHKDIIFVKGQNYYAQDIERVAAEILDKGANEIAVCSINDAARAREEICLFVLFKHDLAAFHPLLAKLRRHLGARLGLGVDHILPIKRMPKTTSGKIQRFRLAQQFAGGDFDELERGIAALDRAARAGREAETLDSLEDEVLARVRERLGDPSIGPEDSLYAHGLDSLRGTLLAAELEARYGGEIDLRRFLREPTAAGLARCLREGADEGEAPITRAAPAGEYPATPAQRGIYFMSQRAGAELLYNLPQAFAIEGRIDRERLAAAFQALVARHEAFRTGFKLVGGDLVQTIAADVRFDLAWKEYGDEDLERVFRDFVRPFDLAAPPLLRANLAKLGNRLYLLVDTHHIVFDGASFQIAAEDLIALYKGDDLPAPKLSYKDYAVWQADFQASPKYGRQLDYWLALFGGDLPALDPPTDYQGTDAAGAYTGGRERLAVDGGTLAAVRELARQTSTTPFLVFLAVYYVLLHLQTGREEIVVGTPLLGRRRPGLAEPVGMFVNSLPIVMAVDAGATFVSFLAALKERFLDAQANQDCHYETIVGHLRQNRDLGREGLFEVMFSLQGMEARPIDLGECRLVPLALETGQAKYPLTLLGVEREDGVRFELEYKKELFRPETARLMLERYLVLLKAFLARPALALCEADHLTGGERALFAALNATATAYPRHRTLPELFAAEAARDPGAAALVMGDTVLTYGELKKGADRIASHLLAAGVEPGGIVALAALRSPEMIAGMLGILQAGAAYLPLDLEQPAGRALELVRDAGAVYMLRHHGPFGPGPGRNGDWPATAEIAVILADGDASGAESVRRFAPDTPAYVMYTSGSTGRPKGILTTHYNVARVVREAGYITIAPGDRLLQLSNYAFDGSTFDIYGALLNGATLVLADQETVLDLDRLAKLIEDAGITVFFVTTALFNLLVDTRPACLRHVRKILFGGERVSVRHVAAAYRILGPGRLIHVYGPTESTVYATYYPVDEEPDPRRTVPIGRPIANTRIRVLDGCGRQAPVGARGELCIIGDGLALGYLGRPDLTRDKFTADPFEPSERMYRTGDLVRMLPDGNLEFLDRLDAQVKIRGFRIELGEIEHAILESGAAREAVAAVLEDGAGSRRIAAYLVPGPGYDEEALRVYLGARLPGYMIPSRFVTLDRLPLNPNGKIDRRSLPPLDPGADKARSAAEPVNEAERKVLAVWREVFGSREIGVDDDFFDLGGHSLRAAHILARLHEELGAEIPLREFFKAGTVRNLAGLIGRRETAPYAPIPPAAPAGSYPLTAMQKGLYLQECRYDTGVSYNIPLVYTAEAGLDPDRLEEALNEVVARHAILRTSFQVVDNEPRQVESARVRVEVERLAADRAGLADVVQAFVRPFDLARAPLLRCGHVALKDGGAALLLDLHHLIGDGVSLAVLFEELDAIMAGRTPPATGVAYRDFAVWQQAQLAGGAWREQAEFWRGRLEGVPPAPDLPIRRGGRRTRTFRGAVIGRELDAASALEIAGLAKSCGVTLNTVLMGALFLLVHKYTGQEEMVIGSLVAGRTHPDLARTVGMFNTSCRSAIPCEGGAWPIFCARRARPCFPPTKTRIIPTISSSTSRGTAIRGAIPFSTSCSSSTTSWKRTRPPISEGWRCVGWLLRPARPSSTSSWIFTPKKAATTRFSSTTRTSTTGRTSSASPTIISASSGRSPPIPGAVWGGSSSCPGRSVRASLGV